MKRTFFPLIFLGMAVLYGLLVGVFPTPSLAAILPECDARCEMINRLYQEVLGREADPEGLQYFYESGGTEDQIRKGLCDSPEGRSPGKPRQGCKEETIKRLYQEVLGREADPEGLQYFYEHGGTEDQIREALCSSSEGRSPGKPRQGCKEATVLLQNGPPLVIISRVKKALKDLAKAGYSADVELLRVTIDGIERQDRGGLLCGASLPYLISIGNCPNGRDRYFVTIHEFGHVMDFADNGLTDASICSAYTDDKEYCAEYWVYRIPQEKSQYLECIKPFPPFDTPFRLVAKGTVLPNSNSCVSTIKEGEKGYYFRVEGADIAKEFPNGMNSALQIPTHAGWSRVNGDPQAIVIRMLSEAPAWGTYDFSLTLKDGRRASASFTHSP